MAPKMLNMSPKNPQTVNPNNIPKHMLNNPRNKRLVVSSWTPILPTLSPQTLKTANRISNMNPKSRHQSPQDAQHDPQDPPRLLADTVKYESDRTWPASSPQDATQEPFRR